MIMKKIFLALFVLLSVATINADTITLSAYIYPRALTPNTPIVLSTTDAENWSDGFGLYLNENGNVSANFTLPISQP